MLRHDYGSASIAEAGGFVPVPAVQVAVEESRAERIAGSKDVRDVYREASHIDRFARVIANLIPVITALATE